MIGRWRVALIAAATAASVAPYGAERAVEQPQPRETGPPAISIATPATGAVIAGNVVEVTLDVSGIPEGARFAVLADRSPPAPGTTISLSRGVVFSSHPAAAIGGLSAGTHAIAVVLADATGGRIGEVAATVSVRTTGSRTLTASAPATAVEGDPWTVTVTVHGIAPVEGGTHLDYLIDLDLPPPGVASSEDAEGIVHTALARVPLTGLAAGIHHVWVVAADSRHRPLLPYVADVVYVKVTV